MPYIGIVPAVFLLLFFILIGILFDIIGIAVAKAHAAPFHSMSSKKVRGAKGALLLIRNAEKVSNFCNDVIGDIAGIISGGAALTIASKLSSRFSADMFYFVVLLSGIVAAITITGKALGKTLALNKSFEIVHMCGVLLHLLGFERKKKNRKT